MSGDGRFRGSNSFSLRDLQASEVALENARDRIPGECQFTNLTSLLRLFVDSNTDVPPPVAICDFISELYTRMGSESPGDP